MKWSFASEIHFPNSRNPRTQTWVRRSKTILALPVKSRNGRTRQGEINTSYDTYSNRLPADEMKRTCQTRRTLGRPFGPDGLSPSILVLSFCLFVFFFPSVFSVLSVRVSVFGVTISNVLRPRAFRLLNCLGYVASFHHARFADENRGWYLVFLIFL